MINVVKDKVFDWLINLLGKLEGARLLRLLVVTSVVSHGWLGGRYQRKIMIICYNVVGAA